MTDDISHANGNRDSEHAIPDVDGAVACGSNSSSAHTFQVLDFNALKQYPDVVEILEDLLERAKQGQTVGIAVICLLSRAQMATVVSSGFAAQAILGLGALDVLKQRILNGVE